MFLLWIDSEVILSKIKSRNTGWEDPSSLRDIVAAYIRAGTAPYKKRLLMILLSVSLRGSYNSWGVICRTPVCTSSHRSA